MAVQVNSFNCGGIVIGLVVAHKLLDASSFLFFLKNWAVIARGGSDIVTPLFKSAAIIPPEAFPTYNPSRGIGKIKIPIKRFVFDSSAIERLRAKYSSDNLSTEYPSPTRVEALSTFIFTQLLAATQVEEDPNKSDTIFRVANLRTRMNPPLSENYFGNMILGTGSVICRDTMDSFQDIIILVTEALRNFDMKFVKRFQESDTNLTFLLQNKERLKKGEGTTLVFTRLCRFPAYEVDFGWGKPVWVGSVRLLFKNLVTFFDTNAGNVIEVWINLEEQDMAKFEVDKELLDYVSSGKISED